MKTLKEFRIQVNEVLKASDPIEKWIDDFVHSKNPKFAGKSTKERIEMAKGAYYGAQKNEVASISQNSTAVTDMNEDHKEAVEYKGIGTDVVDKKKKLNPQPNFTTDKKQVKDFKEDDIKKYKGKLPNNYYGSRIGMYGYGAYPYGEYGYDNYAGDGGMGESVQQFKEEKDDREYGYEGDMAMSQLKTIIRHSEHLMGMLKPDTDLPEWVQSKITLATDYMQTAHDYLMSEMNEEAEQIDEGDSGLAAKAKKSGISLSTLKTVYKRGVAAWNSGHRPGTTPQQWGMARVNSYITKGLGTYGGADKDLHEDARLNKTEYHKGMSDSTAKARVAHWKKADKLSDSNPKAYKPAPGDKTAKTTPSVHTKKYHAMYGEAKVYDPITKKMVATKPIKVQAGGGATRNGVPVETGPSKYKSKLPMSKAAAVLAAEEVELIDEISKQTADSYLSKVTKDQVGKHGMQPNMFDKLPKNRQHGVSNALKRLISPERPSRPGDIHGKSFTEEVQIDELSKGLVARYANKVAKTTQANYDKSKDKFQFSSNRQDGMKNAVKRLTKEESEQIDEVSKSTLMRYIPKASRDVGSHTYAGKEAGEWANHYTRAGDWSAAEKHSKKSYADFKKANKRIAGIDMATKKLGTQKEEVEHVDEAAHVYDTKTNKVHSKHDTYNKAIKAAEKLNKEHPGYDTPGNLIRDKFGVKRIDEAIAKKLPVQHAVDAVHATLGPKSATRFLSHLSPGSDKHTSWDKVNDALVKQGVQTHHIASIAQKTSHMNEEVIDESRGHKVLATFFKNREVAQRSYQGNPAKDAEVAQGGGSPADQGIAAAKADYKKMNKEGVNPTLMAILKKRQEAQKKKAEDKKKVNEAATPAVHAAPAKKTKSTAKEYASATIPGTKRVAGSKSDNNEPGEQIKEDQYTSEYKIKQFVDPVTGENKTRKIRPHRINFKASKMRGEPAQADAQGDYGIKEDGKVYDEKWKEYKGKTFKKESSC